MENPMNQTTVPTPTPVQSGGGFGGKLAIIIVIIVLIVGAYFFFTNKRTDNVMSPSDESQLNDDGATLNQELDAAATANIDADLQQIEAEFE